MATEPTSGARLQEALGGLGHGSSIDRVRADIAWLAEQGLVELGEVGELYVRSRIIFEGYHKRPEATAAGARNGFYSVGDMARRDEQGFYYLADRKTDMIVSGGANIYSAEVEAALHEHPAIDEAAVIGVPDERLQEAVKAYVVLEPGQTLTAEDVQAFCATRIASFKKPRQVEFVRYLPKNPTGKILKRELREWHGGKLPDEARPESAPPPPPGATARTDS